MVILLLTNVLRNAPKASYRFFTALPNTHVNLTFNIPFLGKNSSANQQALLHQKLLLEILLMTNYVTWFRSFSSDCLASVSFRGLHVPTLQSRLERRWQIISHCSVCLFCLFIWSLSSHSRIFHSYGDVKEYWHRLTDSLCYVVWWWLQVFLLNWQTMMCRLHGSYDPSNMTVNGKGWRTHANQSFGG